MDMFKMVIAGICLLVHVQAVPAPGHGYMKGYCNTNSHFEEDECCLSFIQRRGKRAAETLPDDPKRFVRGKCKKRGTSGSKCFMTDFGSLITDIHYDACPCLAEHTCEGTGKVIRPQGEIGTCVKQCSSDTDCGADECCVSNSRPIGKRSTRRMRGQFTGHCRPMGTLGSGCLVKNGSGRPDGVVVHSCPCEEFSTCIGSDVFEIPLGEIGKCGKHAYLQ